MDENLNIHIKLYKPLTERYNLRWKILFKIQKYCENKNELRIGFKNCDKK